MEHHQPVPAVKAKNSKNVIQKGTGGVMGEHELFKTTIMGGFDKEDVLEQVQRMKDEAASEQLRLKKLISEKDAKIAELMKRIELKDAHQERLEMEIHEKYQKYIDNYESIGKLVFDAQLKSDAMIKEGRGEVQYHDFPRGSRGKTARGKQCSQKLMINCGRARKNT